MKTKYRFLSLFFILGLATLACGQLEIGLEESQPLPVQVNQGDNNDVILDTPETETEPQPEKTAAREEAQIEDYSQYWVEVEDYRTGLRFATPCFWVANIPTPDQNSGGLGSFSVNNFSQDFIQSLGPKRSQTVFEIGGLKFDLSYQTMEEHNLSPNATLEELAYALVNPDQDHGINSTIPFEINGKTALEVNSWSIFGESKFYLLPFVNDLYIHFAPSNADHPDLQAILYSLVLDPALQIQLPTLHPAEPPEGMAAPCIGQTQPTSSTSGESSLSGRLDCNTVNESEKLMWVICNVEASFVSRNTQPLLGIMGEPFKIGYWQSEGVERTKPEAINEIGSYLLPPDTSAMTFTLDESLFPPLYGMDPEQIFPPDANIVEVVYSEGWGESGQGAAMLYFSEMPNGKPYFYGMLIAGGHFDK